MLALVIIFCLIISPAWAVNLNDAQNFLRDKIPAQVLEKFSREITKNNNSPSCVIEHAGEVYSFCVVQIKTSPNKNLQNTLKLSAMRQASLKAAGNLARYLDNGKTFTKDFQNTDAVNEVLRLHYEERVNFRSAENFSGGEVFALVWSKKINAPMSAKEIIDSCVYLRAIGANDYAASVAGEVVKVFSGDLSPDDLAIAGRILFDAGKKDEGFNALERAFEIIRR